MARINAINNESQELTLDPGASGDSFVQFDINGTGEFRIGVDDTDDSFRISQGSALGTNDTFVVTDAGEITKPLQPAFLATVTSAITNVTGDGTTYTIVFDTEVFDQNGDFDGTSTFTAPITGKYQFDCAVSVDGLTASHTSSNTRLVTSNTTYLTQQLNPAAIRDASDTVGYVFSVLVDMDASDTATFSIGVSGGALVVDIATNGATDPYTTFSGNLQV